MRFPAQIKIGPMVYDLSLDHHPDHPLGRHDVFDQTIKVYGRACPTLRLQTLWHEIVHGVVCHFFGDDGDHDEKKISVWGTAIMSVLLDNPELCQMMLREARARVPKSLVKKRRRSRRKA